MELPMPKTHDFTTTRIFDAPLKEVWKAWYDPDLVKQWWGPVGFTGTVADMDFREGGTSLVGMRAPADFGGQEMFNTWKYTKIVPQERIEYILAFTDEAGNAFDPAEAGLLAGIPREVRNVNIFKDLGGGRTELTVSEYGYGSAQAANFSKLGLEQCLDKMAALLAK
jgi:uncharacterized protein YndB with AHSA1/START domain